MMFKTFLAGALMGFASVVMAQVTIETKVFKVEFQDVAGEVQETWVEPEKIIPGNRVGYQIDITNQGSEPATDISINNPVPENTTYLAGTIEGEDMSTQVSVDGGSTFGQLIDLQVVENGQLRPANASDVTHVNWQLNSALEPGQQKSARYQVSVN